MEANLHEATTAPLDLVTVNGCGKREGPMSSELSELAGDNLRNFSQQEEIAKLGLPMDESVSTKWTNEKHSLYLNSMEASFVKQLYNQKSSSMDSLDWPSEKNTLTHKNYCASSHNSCGQFKVIRYGCWQKVNSDQDEPKLSTSGNSHFVQQSRWIQHFRSALKHQEIRWPHEKKKGAQVNEAMHFRRWKRHYNGLDTRLCHQDSVSGSEEVSDQNFVNEEHEEEEKQISLCREKRMKAGR